MSHLPAVRTTSENKTSRYLMPLPANPSASVRRLNPHLFGGLPTVPVQVAPWPSTVQPSRAPVQSTDKGGEFHIQKAFFTSHKLPEFVPEFRFAPPRRWRFDFAWPQHKIALEVEGGVWTKGRHTRGAGFMADIEKYNEAACLGWRVVRTTPDLLLTAETAHLILRLLEKVPHL